MRKIIIPLMLVLTSCQTLEKVSLECGNSKNIVKPITLTNNSKVPLVCYRAEIVDKEWKLSQDFEISPSVSASVRTCSYREYLACNLITGQGYSTQLTYINPYQSGEYKVTLQEVPWDEQNSSNKCEINTKLEATNNITATKKRAATVIELPNGENYY